MPCFSSKCTWNIIRTSSPKVTWSQIVWFPQAVPRYSFMAWLAIKDRLSTGQRMRRWGQEQSCPFCGERDESRDHIFFACPYTFCVWSALCNPLLRRHTTPDWNNTLQAIISRTSPVNDVALIRMIFQTTIYHVWRERNGRIHKVDHIHHYHQLTYAPSRTASSVSSTNQEVSTNSSSLDGLHYEGHHHKRSGLCFLFLFFQTFLNFPV